MVKRADSAATTRSPARARLIPPPAATPLTAMITGFAVRARRETAPCRYVVSSLITTPMRSALSLKSLTSPPAQKAFPVPVITMQRAARSSSASRVAWKSSPPIRAASLAAVAVAVELEKIGGVCYRHGRHRDDHDDVPVAHGAVAEQGR